MANYTLELYRQMITSLKRGNTKGVFSNAKPLFLITLFDYIPNLKQNRISWGISALEVSYLKNFAELTEDKPTPLWKPFFYMSSEPFYELIWKVIPSEKSIKYPSEKTLKVFLNYAKFDKELWDLLQDHEARNYLRDCIIHQYFTGE